MMAKQEQIFNDIFNNLKGDDHLLNTRHDCNRIHSFFNANLDDDDQEEGGDENDNESMDRQSMVDFLVESFTNQIKDPCWLPIVDLSSDEDGDEEEEEEEDDDEESENSTESSPNRKNYNLRQRRTASFQNPQRRNLGKVSQSVVGDATTTDRDEPCFTLANQLKTLILNSNRTKMANREVFYY